KGELGHVAYAHALADFSADEVSCGHEAIEGVVLRFFISEYGDEDATALATGSKDHLRDMTGSDARVRQLAFQHRGDLLGEGAGDSVTMVLSGSLLGHKGDCAG